MLGFCTEEERSQLVALRSVRPHPELARSIEFINADLAGISGDPAEYCVFPHGDR